MSTLPFKARQRQSRRVSPREWQNGGHPEASVGINDRLDRAADRILAGRPVPALPTQPTASDPEQPKRWREIKSPFEQRGPRQFGIVVPPASAPRRASAKALELDPVLAIWQSLTGRRFDPAQRAAFLALTEVSELHRIDWSVLWKVGKRIVRSGPGRDLDPKRWIGECITATAPPRPVVVTPDVAPVYRQTRKVVRGLPPTQRYDDET